MHTATWQLHPIVVTNEYSRSLRFSLSVTTIWIQYKGLDTIEA